MIFDDTVSHKNIPRLCPFIKFELVRIHILGRVLTVRKSTMYGIVLHSIYFFAKSL